MVSAAGGILPYTPRMRFYILRALFVKEVRRHLSNRGGMALAGLLVVAALLLSVFNPAKVEDGVGGGDLLDGVHLCTLEYASQTPFITRLESKLPDDLRSTLRFTEVPPETVEVSNPTPGTGVIRVVEQSTDGPPKITFDIWHPPGDAGTMAPYERWFFRAARDVLSEMAVEKLKSTQGDAGGLTLPPLRDDDLWAVQEAFRTLDESVERARHTPGETRLLPAVAIKRHPLGAKPLDYRTAIATAMVVFALYFCCSYLLPTLNCEERERGVLLAQALSPASPFEIVAAKFFFYPVAGVLLAAVLAGIYNPAVLQSLFFWLSLLALGCGFLGIGMTVSTLAKTQRAAFMGSMCYLLVVSLIVFICSQNHIPYIPEFAIEFHGPKILFAAMTQNVTWVDWLHLLATFILAAVWMSVATVLFRKRGWQ